VDPFRRIGPRLLRSPLLGRSERESLLTRLDDLQAGFAAGVPPGLPSSVVHGDAWAGNVVETDSGEVLLLDLGRVGIGPPEWDLVATVLNRTTFGIMGEEEYAAFCSAYGHDVMTWQGFPLLRDIRELWVVAFALQAAEVDGQAVPQARARVQDLLAGRRPWPGWAPL
jgi:aminoglycoside phosphotransferase (APT) family kinase protein